MKKQTVFIELKGYLSDYAKTIYTQTASSSKDIQALQAHLNVIIKQAQTLPATAENCKSLWETLTTTVKNSAITDKKQQTYLEIIEAVDNIGKEIAYLGYRKGWKYRPIKIYSTYNDEELMEAFKIIILNEYNDKNLGLSLVKNHKEYQEVIDQRGYYKMTDEELLVEAKKMAEYVRAKREEKPVTFKATGTEDIKFFND